MPNRVLRSWVDSFKVHQLSVHCERFFTRLIMVVDDYGRFYSDVRLLKSSCFPLLLDSIREADISRWLTELANTTGENGEKSGLIILYEVSGKRYLQIQDFRQTLRQKRVKYPPPKEPAQQLLSNSVPESETKPNPETESETKRKNAQNFDLFISNFNLLTKREFKGNKELSAELADRLKEGFTMEQISNAIINCFNDPFHKEKPNYLTPEFILRPDKLDKYVNYIKVGKKVNGFPDYYDSDLVKRIQGKDLSKYWTHLREMGLKPKKVNGVTVDWIPA